MGIEVTARVPARQCRTRCGPEFPADGGILARRDAEFREAYGFGLPAPAGTLRAAARDGWRLESRRGGIGQSYVAESCVEPPFHVLRQGDVLWMSDSLLELESHAWHVDRARGLVVVAGLGMGMYALAAAARPEVRRVVVAEIDPNLAGMLAAAGRRLPDKVELVVADATTDAGIASIAGALRGGRPDYLYADIWPTYPDPGAPGTTARLAAALGASEAGWWGQEAAVAHHADAEGLELDGASVLAFGRSRGVPIRSTPGYVAFCRDVALAHGLAVDGPSAPRGMVP